jgi:hypothetical protein
MTDKAGDPYKLSPRQQWMAITLTTSRVPGARTRPKPGGARAAWMLPAPRSAKNTMRQCRRHARTARHAGKADVAPVSGKGAREGS